MTAPKERPILFSAPMVRAILDGRKTQTRRIVKPQPHAGVRKSPFVASGLEDGHGRGLRCPFGAPGDRLYVKEAVRFPAACDGFAPSAIAPNVPIWYEADGAKANITNAGQCGRYRHAMFMPRWASRITLEITDVQVQRLQEISDEDALAEGLRSDGSLGAQCSVELPGHRTHHDSPKECFRLLWESIHGPGSWDVNPFVWVIVFRRIGL